MIYRLFIKGISGSSFQHDAAWELLDTALMCEYGIDMKKERILRTENGKPHFPDNKDILFNLSHTDGCVAAIIESRSAGAVSVGIDVEKIRPFDERLFRKVLTEDEKRILEDSTDRERDFFRLWVLKESYVKALGIGISYGLKNVSFSWDASGNICSSVKNAEFRIISDNSEYILGACVLKKESTV